MQNPLSFLHCRYFYRLVVGIYLLVILLSGMLWVPSLGSSVAEAAGGQASFALQPAVYDPSNPTTRSYFIMNNRPGDVAKSSIRVTNVGTVSGTVNLYPVDATTSEASGAVYLGRNDPRHDVGAWIVLSQQQLTLAPGQSQIVTFQVAIPGQVRSGQHLGGIVAENLAQQSSTQTQNNSTFQINVKTLTVVAVLVNLPGTPIEQLAATGVQAGGENGYQRLLIGLSNTGNMLLKPYGMLQVSDEQGHVLKNLSLKLDTFLPQTSINYPVLVTGQALGVGEYAATLNLTYGHGKVLHYTTNFGITQQQIEEVFDPGRTQAPPGFLNGAFSGVTPWLVAGGGLVLLLIVGSLLYWLVLVPRARANAKQAAHSSQFTRLSQFKGSGTSMSQFKGPGTR